MSTTIFFLGLWNRHVNPHFFLKMVVENAYSTSLKKNGGWKCLFHKPRNFQPPELGICAIFILVVTLTCWQRKRNCNLCYLYNPTDMYNKFYFNCVKNWQLIHQFITWIRKILSTNYLLIKGKIIVYSRSTINACSFLLHGEPH